MVVVVVVAAAVVPTPGRVQYGKLDEHGRARHGSDMTTALT